MKLTNYSKLGIAALAIASMLFAGCADKKVVGQSGDHKSGTHSSSHGKQATHAVKGKGVAGKPAAGAVYFSFDSSALDASAEAILDGYASWLNDHAGVSVTIEGNCDQRGAREYNHALGQQRADSIRSYLSNRGVDSNRVDTVSFGEEQAACSGTGEACWAQNRRADIVTR
ncbi:MAG: peptidoglycan-associated lipoprotein Pal [Mariprofundaceae bacterium]